jgi:hypothetical protein
MANIYVVNVLGRLRACENCFIETYYCTDFKSHVHVQPCTHNYMYN